MISPTIGRVVLVHASVTARDAGSQAMPALVVYVHSDRCINVGGFDSSGGPFSYCSLMLLQDDDAAPALGPFAEWMPYQKGQAAKTEALQSQLAARPALTEADAAADLAGLPRPDASGPVSA